MRLLHLTTRDQQCGIRQYSEQMVACLPGENLLRCEGEDWPLDVTAVHCQWSGGAFFSAHLEQFRQECRLKNIPFLVTAHNCLGSIPRLSPDHVFVHSARTAHEIQDLGLDREMISQIPHPVSAITRVAPPEPGLICLFGFLLPHKGCLVAIEAIQHLQTLQPGFRLLLQTPIHPQHAAEGERLAHEIRRMVDVRELTEVVEMATAFLATDALNRQLSRADLFIFPYEHDAAQASSAAVRVGMSYGRPTIATNLPLFSGLEGCVHASPGDALDLAHMIQQVSEPGLLARLAQEAALGGERQSWSHVAAFIARVYEEMPAKRAQKPATGTVLSSSTMAIPTLVPDRKTGERWWRLRAGGRVPYSFSHVLSQWGEALVRQGHRVILENLAPEHTRDFPAHLSPLAEADWQINFTYPPQFTKSGRNQKFAEVLCWETTKFPQPWAAQAAAMDRVLTLSGYSRDVLVNSGVPEEKIRVVPGGVDHATFTPQGTRACWADYGGDEQTVCFFHVGALDARKGTPELLQAYFEAFDGHDNVLLFIKNNSFANHFNLRELIANAACDRPRRAGHPPRVVFRSEDWPAHVLAAHMRAATAGVFPYRAEGGFGLCPLEMLACGVPVIVSHFGAPPEYVTPACGWLLPGRRVPSGFASGHHKEEPGSYWFAPHGAQLAAWLREIFENPAQAVLRGAEGPAVAAPYTWEKSATCLGEALD